jgi:hypothetical protein
MLPAALFIFIKCLKDNTLLLKYNKLISNGLVVVLLVLFCGFYGNVKSQAQELSENKLITESEFYNQNKEVSDYILENTNPDDYIVVFGWAAQLNIHTNRKSATAQSDSHRLWGKWSHENIEKYIEDIKRNKPKLIIDAVTPYMFLLHFSHPGFYVQNVAEEDYSLENHTEIWNTIKDDYKLTEIFPLIKKEGRVKIYTRVD